MFAYVGSRTTRERNARGDGISVYRYVGVPKAATFTTGGQAMTAFFE